VYHGARSKVPRLRRPFACVVILAAVLARLGPADAGEIRGRILIGERPAPGVTVSAIPYEPPDVEARRLARAAEAPRPLAAATTRGDGTFAVTLAAAPGVTVRFLAAGGGVVPSWMGGTYDAAESDDLGEHVLARAETLAGRVVSATGAPVAGAAVTVWPRGAAVRGDAEVAPAARTVITGADGVFRSSEAASDDNRLTVVARSYGSATIPNVRAGAMPRPIGSVSAPSLPVWSCAPIARPPRRACWCGSRPGAWRRRGSKRARTDGSSSWTCPRGRGRSSPKGETPAWARRRRAPCRRRRDGCSRSCWRRPRRSRARPSTPGRARPCRACASRRRTARGRARTARGRTAATAFAGSSRSGHTACAPTSRATRRTSARACCSPRRRRGASTFRSPWPRR